MSTDSALERSQSRLDSATAKWWLYPLLFLLFFIPAYASEAYDPTETLALIEEALTNPLIYSFPRLMPLAKLVPVLLIAALAVLGNRVRRLFTAYVALLYTALALFQITAQTPTYGFVLISGNLALVLVVALAWAWEAMAARADLTPRKQPLWKWWVAPLAVLAFLAPIDTGTLAPDFSVVGMLTNPAGLTYCMMTPVILAVLTMYHPKVNRFVLRVSSFVGMIYGAVNTIVWFVLIPSGWWMGVLHIPLLLISIYAFVLGHLRTED